MGGGFFIFNYVLSVCGYAQVNAGACRGQRHWPHPWSSLMGTFCKCCRISFLLSRFSFLSLGWEFLHYWFSLLVFGLFRFLFLSDSILIGCRFLRIYLFLLGYSKCRYVVVHNSLLLYFVLVDLSFIYGFIYLRFLS